MTMLGRASVLATILIATIAPTGMARDDWACDSASPDLVRVHASCLYDSIEPYLQTYASNGWVYKFVPLFENKGIGDERIPCAEPSTYRYVVLVNRNDNQGLVRAGEACLTPGEAGDVKPQITIQMVIAEMKKLAWNKPDLIIQPPNGTTLVNLPTNFYTTLTEPQTLQITLLGQQVEIEATPSSYVWHFGDGASDSGTSPGSPYAEGKDLDVSYTYLRTGDYAPSVDVVYSGRYRVNDGEWITIPETLTVAGDPQSLEVIEAVPRLVG